jgi:two-component system CheB/CheR fusion protein
MVNERSFPIAGIGVSASDLEALQEFLSGFSSDSASGIAFVVVPHTTPPGESFTDAVRLLTRLPVCEVADGIKLEPNCVYVVNTHQAPICREGHIYLADFCPESRLHMPIDNFFRSLAHDQQERSIGVVLLGTGTDGALGITAIKGENGLVMVQGPDTSEHISMRESVFSTNAVDFVLSPQDMAVQLLSYVRQMESTPSRSCSSFSESEDLSQQLFGLIHVTTGHDFSQYKRSAIYRRIERRMAIRRLHYVDDYLEYLRENPQEVESLAQDFLIGVTRFFRDPDAFNVLREQVIPAICKTKKPGETIRIWVPGCSTGEEAYSIAICFQQHMEELNLQYKLSVFATDINSHAIEYARAGIYPRNIAADVPPTILARYFADVLEGAAYRISSRIRDNIVFAEQNVTRDPPYSRMDFISCRNLLIYFDTELQKRALQIISYSLVKDGFLLLGGSETTGAVTESFTTVDAKWKVFRKGGSLPQPPFKGLSARLLETASATRPLYADNREGKTSLRQLVEEVLLYQYAPACAVVNRFGEILYIHGRTGRYLEPSSGNARMNILQMAREGLRLELSSAINRVATLREPQYYKGLRVKGDTAHSLLDLSVQPVVAGPASLQDLILVVFQEGNPGPHPEVVSADEFAATSEDAPQSDMRYVALESESRRKEQFLMSVIEELEAAMAEHQSANEEHQSTNEELETSKEELQSVNEELMTVNYELKKSIEELNTANSDIENMLAGTGVGTVFLDDRLCIKRFTPAACDIFNLIEGDVGRPLGHTSYNFLNYDNIVEDVQGVLDTLEPKQVEVDTRHNQHFLLRIMPYRNLGGVVEGAVLTTINITDQKLLQRAAERLAIVVRDSNDAVAVLDMNGRFIAWNHRAMDIYGWSEQEALGMTLSETVPDEVRNRAFLDIVTLARTESIEPLEMVRLCKDGRQKRVCLAASLLVGKDQVPYAIATTERLM